LATCGHGLHRSSNDEQRIIMLRDIQQRSESQRRDCWLSEYYCR